MRKSSIISVLFLLKIRRLNLNHEETLDEPKLRDILYNNWPVIVKSVNVTEVKQRPRNCD